MCKSVQACIKPPWCQEMLNGSSDICSKPSMSSNEHLMIECLVTAVAAMLGHCLVIAWSLQCLVTAWSMLGTAMAVLISCTLIQQC